jgi:peptide/nickel transport system permease protein
MPSFIARRLLAALPVLVGISLITFGFLKLTGAKGGICAAILGERYTEERCAVIRQKFGWDESLALQYGRYLARTVQGDLGESMVTRRAVAAELGERFPATMELALVAMLLAVLVGVPLGIVAAARHNTWVDLSAMLVALGGVSMPVFWLGLMMIYVLAVRLDLFPTSGRLSSGMVLVDRTHLHLVDSLLARDLAAFKDALHHLVLPAVALSTIPASIIARIARSAMLDVLGQDYIRTARAKGLGERAVVLRHALANALLPVVTVVGLQTGYLLSGAVLTETIFSWPGVGSWMVNAISSNDLPVVQGGVLVFAIVFVLINLLVDISYAWLDPRIRYG